MASIKDFINEAEGDFNLEVLNLKKQDDKTPNKDSFPDKDSSVENKFRGYIEKIENLVRSIDKLTGKIPSKSNIPSGVKRTDKQVRLELALNKFRSKAEYYTKHLKKRTEKYLSQIKDESKRAKAEKPKIRKTLFKNLLKSEKNEINTFINELEDVFNNLSPYAKKFDKASKPFEKEFKKNLEKDKKLSSISKDFAKKQDKYRKENLAKVKTKLAKSETKLANKPWVKDWKERVKSKMSANSEEKE